MSDPSQNPDAPRGNPGAVAAPRVVVYDYGSGNVRSVVRAFEAAGAEVTLTGDRRAALAADGLVVPGVGAFAAVMSAMTASGAPSVIETRLVGGRPVLGICVAHQAFFEWGVEHGTRTAGLGQWPGEVTRLSADIVPHMGWSTVSAASGSRLFAGIEDERFYFVHSYAARQWDFVGHASIPAPQVTWADHGGPFIAAIENGPLVATQFHPEKSGAAGARLIRNWLGTLPSAANRPAGPVGS